MRKPVLHHSHGTMGILWHSFVQKGYFGISELPSVLASESSGGTHVFFLLYAGQKSPESSKVRFPVMPTCFCMFYSIGESVSHQVIIGTSTTRRQERVDP